MTPLWIGLSLGGVIGLLVIGIAVLSRVSQLLALQPSARFDGLEKAQERMERSLKEEIAKNRDESQSNARNAREELAHSLKTYNDSILTRLAEGAHSQITQLDVFTKQLSTLTQ